MPHDHRVVGLTPEEIRLRGKLGQVKRWNKPDAEIRAAEIQYQLAVARRRAAEYAAEAERLEAELAAVS